MRRLVDGILRAFEFVFMRIAQLAMAIMMLGISADALGRYLFNTPLQGSFEFTSLYLMIIVTFLGMPATYTAGGMVRLEVLTGRLARVPGRIPARLNAGLGAAVFGFLAWHAGLEAIDKFRAGDTTFGAVQFPLYWSYVWFPMGAALLAARLAFETLFPARTAGTAAQGDSE